MKSCGDGIQLDNSVVDFDFVNTAFNSFVLLDALHQFSYKGTLDCLRMQS